MRRPSIRRATDSPRDYGAKQGLNAAFGGTRTLTDAMELVVDAGVRHKDQQSVFFDYGDTYDDRSLTTASLTPRLTVTHMLFGLPGKATTGIDLYQSYFTDNQEVDQGDAPVHRYSLGQRTLAGYLKDRISIRPGTDLSFGLRLQNDDVSARDRYNPSAVNNGNFSFAQGRPLDKTDTQDAFGPRPRPPSDRQHHPCSDGSAIVSACRRWTSGWGRRPGERRSISTSSRRLPTTWKPACGGHWGAFGLQSSVYFMALRDELHYSPATYTNINLDPTRRYGVENAATYQLTEVIGLKGGLTYSRAQFTEGVWKGNDVPLVSRWTGNGGVSLDHLWQAGGVRRRCALCRRQTLRQ